MSKINPLGFKWPGTGGAGVTSGTIGSGTPAYTQSGISAFTSLGAINGTNSNPNYFTVAGDVTGTLAPTAPVYLVDGSTGNDGGYLRPGANVWEYTNPNTIVYVIDDIVNPTVDGTLYYAPTTTITHNLGTQNIAVYLKGTFGIAHIFPLFIAPLNDNQILTSITAAWALRKILAPATTYDIDIYTL